MAAKAVVDAVSTRLEAEWTRTPVFSANSHGVAPTDGSPFLVALFPVANVERVVMNERYYREEGGIRFVLSIERGSGTDVGMGWADELAGLFREQKFDGVETGVPTSPLIYDDNEEGNYFRITVVVPYEYKFRD